MSKFQFQEFGKAEEFIFLIFWETRDRIFQAVRLLVLALKVLPIPILLHWQVPSSFVFLKTLYFFNF